MEQAIVIRSRLIIYLFLLLGPILGCNPPQIVHSPCANVNVTLQIKLSANLSFTFGNDAIQAAMDSISREIAQNANGSISALTKTGTEVAFRTAKANGKSPVANDITELETLLREGVIPTIKQNPTCILNVASSGRPYVGIERVFLKSMEGKQIPVVAIKNTGLADVSSHIVIREIIDGIEYSKVSTNIRLGPNQGKSFSIKEPDLPISDIQSGKTVFTVAVDISYPLEGSPSPVLHQEAWRYDRTNNTFFLSPLK